MTGVIILGLYLAESEQEKVSPLDVHEAVKEVLQRADVDMHRARLETGRDGAGNVITSGRLPRAA